MTRAAAMLVAAGVVACAASASARDLGVRGATWPVAEPDLLGQIEARLVEMERSGELAGLEQRRLAPMPGHDWRSRTRRPASRGPREERSRLWDPAITVARDIRTADGVLIAAAGTRVNPLERVALVRDLLFVDGRREAEIAWALAHEPPAKIVLLAGRPLALMRQYRRPFFFDQGGRLAARFGLAFRRRAWSRRTGRGSASTEIPVESLPSRLGGRDGLPGSGDRSGPQHRRGGLKPMLNMNRATLVGHAGRDPEMRDLKNGGKAAVFTLATTEKWKDARRSPGRGDGMAPRRGLRRRRRRRSEAMLRKGDRVMVEGRIATRGFTDREGNDRAVTEIVVSGWQGMVNILTGRRGQEATPDAEAVRRRGRNRRHDPPHEGRAFRPRSRCWPCCGPRRPRRSPAPDGSSTRSRTSAGSACSRSRSGRSPSAASRACSTRRIRPRRSASAARPSPASASRSGSGSRQGWSTRRGRPGASPTSAASPSTPACRPGAGAPGAAGGDGAKGSVWHAHYYMYPLLSWIGVLLDLGCLEGGGLDIAWASELDPAWLDDELSFLLNPEAALFANLPAQAACAADCAASSAGLPLDPLFWCAGCQGGMYPLTGNVAAHVGGRAGLAARVPAPALPPPPRRRSPGGRWAPARSAGATRCPS